MKTIVKGRPQEGWAKEITCTGAGNNDGGCNSLLLVEHGDLFHTYCISLHETETFLTFKCCECGVLNDLKRGYWPRGHFPTQKEWERNNEHTYAVATVS